jgi:hypothetical protein
MSGFGFFSVSNINTGLNFKGTWDALTNNPTLTSSVGVGGDYYIVSIAGNTNLNGITDWQVGDWAIFESATNMWQKVDNHNVQAYSTIQEEGVNLPQQSVIDFQGTGVTASNGTGKTIITIPSPTTYGLYAQIANSVPVAATIIEGTLIGSGLGVLNIPANGFSQGDSFRADLGGVLNSKNNDTLRIRVKAGSIVLGDSLAQTMPASTNDVWQLSLNFTIRATGVSGVASIVTLGEFHYTKTSNGTQQGFAFNTINSTTFDTTIGNTLNITAEWSSNSALNSIYSDIFILNKIY